MARDCTKPSWVWKSEAFTQQWDTTLQKKEISKINVNVEMNSVNAKMNPNLIIFIIIFVFYLSNLSNLNYYCYNN